MSVCACVCASNFVLFLGGERVGVRLREVYILIFMYSILPKICASVCVCVLVSMLRAFAAVALGEQLCFNAHHHMDNFYLQFMHK